MSTSVAHARRLALALALSVAPGTLSAQHAATARAGIAPRVTLAVRVHADTVSTDSVAPHRSQFRSRVAHAAAGAFIGGAAGLVAGYVSVVRANHHCAHSYDSCDGIGILIPIYGAIGFGAGLITGAVWPTH